MGILDKVKQLFSQNVDTIGSAIDEAGKFVDEKTEGKYSDTIGTVKEEAKKALDDRAKGD
jgi:uncharacterized protein YjbJ (UPF0337 family)